MKKYISFIIFFAMLEFLTSFFLSTSLGKKFFANREDNFSELNSGNEIEFGSAFRGKLYFFENRPTLYYTNPTWRQLARVLYCDSSTCLLTGDYVKKYKIEDAVVKTDTYDKTNEVLFKPLDYYDVFGKYDLSYSGWKVRMPGNDYKTDTYYDIVLFPQKDRSLNTCAFSTNTKRKWYRTRSIDITKSRWVKENIGERSGWTISDDSYTSIWDNPETINFDASAGDIIKIQLQISRNSSVLFFIDGVSATPSGETITNFDGVIKYYDYEFEIDTTGNHSITIAHKNELADISRVKRLDDDLLPYSIINKMEISSFVNEGRNLDETNLEDGDYIIERFECSDGHVDEKSMEYKIDKDE